VERANALIFEAIKKILEGKRKGKWAEVMPRVVWSHNTIVCRATNFRPFRLLHGAEAVGPEETKHQSVWIATEVPPCPSEAEEKDFREPDMLTAVVNLQKYQDKTKAWRDPMVKLWELDFGDLVLLWAPRTKIFGKLEAKWVGTYVVVEKSRLGTYRHSDSEGKMLEHF
jgi:hypothetical protein